MGLFRRHPYVTLVTVLLAGGALFVAWSVRRNAARRLTPERLEAARALWDRKGPKDYRLTYTILRGGAGEADEYQVRVKNGEAVEATINGRDAEKGALGAYGMDRLFDFIERFFRVDADRSKEKAHYVADFDDEDGHLIWYYRHVPGTRESVTIEVRSLE
ncbi:MAG: DUF6174 domain-containing protein [Gemmataceae bacterium]